MAIFVILSWMTNVPHLRLVNQRIASTDCKTPGHVVAALGAIQAQDYSGALWSVGLRLPEATEAEVERAIATRKIVRTWPLRGTLHFVAAADVHWMLDLLAPRIIAARARVAHGMDLDDATIIRAEKIIVRALQDQKQLAREALMKLLEQNKISTASQRGYHILWRLAQEKLICFGPRMDKQHTFVLLDDWLPAPRKRNRDAALAEIAFRYFTSHGPATLQDFIAWTGLNAADARAGLDSVAAKLTREVIDGVTYWLPRSSAKISATASGAYILPGFDEYLLGYRDRSAVLNALHARKVVPVSNGRFLPVIVSNGLVAGTWKSELTGDTLALKFSAFNRLKKAEELSVAAAATRYRQFLGHTGEMKCRAI